MKIEWECPESFSPRMLVGVAVGGIFALAFMVFLFLDWRVRDVCKWSHFEEMPSLSKRVDLISSIFKLNTYHIYFVQDYRDYSNKEKLLNDINKNREQIIKQQKSAGFQGNSIKVSPIGEIYEYKGPTPWSEKSELFGMNGLAIDVQTSDEKLYKSFSSVAVTISHQPKTNVQTSHGQ